MRFGKSLSGTTHLIWWGFSAVCHTVLGKPCGRSEKHQKWAICAPTKYFTSRKFQLLQKKARDEYFSLNTILQCYGERASTSAERSQLLPTPLLPEITSSRLGPLQSPSSRFSNWYHLVSLKSVCVGYLGLLPASHPFLFPPDGQLRILGQIFLAGVW